MTATVTVLTHTLIAWKMEKDEPALFDIVLPGAVSREIVILFFFCVILIIVI